MATDPHRRDAPDARVLGLPVLVSPAVRPGQILVVPAGWQRRVARALGLRDTWETLLGFQRSEDIARRSRIARFLAEEPARFADLERRLYALAAELGERYGFDGTPEGMKRRREAR